SLLKTADHWPGWPEGFVPQAAVNWGNDKVYFFSDTQYLRYDIAADQVDPDYPDDISTGWSLWPIE
ncbi:MAG: hypothetical protein HOH77_11370, partial [Candidatus Latescibacteria bacterium]|nr:hypothetical protein [Candidatus Latescibacterota bacterium]